MFSDSIKNLFLKKYNLSQKPIRILRLITRLNIGGPAIQAITLTGELPQERYRTLLACGRINPGEGNMVYLAEEKNIRPLSIPDLGREVSLLQDLKAFIGVRKTIKAIKPHILHTHTAKAGSIGRLAALSVNIGLPKYERIRMVHTYHGHVFHSYFSSLKTYLYILIEKLLAKFTDRIIVISSLQQQDICNRFRITGKQKVRIIPLGFDLSAFKDIASKRKAVRKKYFPEEPDDIFLAGIIGRLSPIKNHIMLFRAIAYLKAINELKPFRFLVIGDGELKEILMHYAAEMHIKDYVVFTGWQKDMTSMYAALDAVVLTSKNEGTPVALIEAMAAQKPVVATGVGGVPDLLGRIIETKSSGFQIAENGILVPSDNHKALTEALLFLYKQSDLVSVHTTHAHEFVMKNYSKERLLNDIKRLYAELLSDHEPQ